MHCYVISILLVIISLSAIRSPLIRCSGSCRWGFQDCLSERLQGKVSENSMVKIRLIIVLLPEFNVLPLIAPDPVSHVAYNRP